MRSILEYIRSDYYRYTGEKKSLLRMIFVALTARNQCFAYNFWMRLASRRNPFFYIAKYMHKRLSRKYGIEISPNCKIGYGFYIGHAVGIIINAKTIIGNNCSVSQFLSIGSNKNTPAIIGDNVYIGPHVCIVEDVQIGSNVTIGAGAVIINNVPENSTAVGCPARILKGNKHPEYIINRYLK